MREGCSRNQEEYVLQGKVRVNGRVINNLSTEIDENKDKVTIDEKIITLEKENVYIMLNKPKGYVTTNLEQFGRKSTLDLINENIRVFPIGRLDMYTEGLLLFTNDGEFANKLMHPKNCIKKVYEVRVDRKIEDSMIETLENGVDIGLKKEDVEIKVLESEDKRSFFSILAPRVVKVEIITITLVLQKALIIILMEVV